MCPEVSQLEQAGTVCVWHGAASAVLAEATPAAHTAGGWPLALSRAPERAVITSTLSCPAVTTAISHSGKFHAHLQPFVNDDSVHISYLFCLHML